MIFWVVYQSFYFSYTQKPRLRPRPGRAKPKPASFGLASSIYKPRPMKARPKPGLSGQAQAGTSLSRNEDSVTEKKEKMLARYACLNDKGIETHKPNVSF